MRFPLFLTIAVLAIGCRPGGINDGGDGEGPFTPPFTPTATGASQPWRSQSAHACPDELMVRAKDYLLGRTITGSIDVVIPGAAVVAVFDSATVWLYADGASGFSTVANETDPAWSSLGNYEVDRASGQAIGQVETEKNGRAIVHMMLHHYEVRVLGKSVADTAKHGGWSANGFSAAAQGWSETVDPTTGYPCLAPNPPPED